MLVKWVAICNNQVSANMGLICISQTHGIGNESGWSAGGRLAPDDDNDDDDGADGG